MLSVQEYWSISTRADSNILTPLIHVLASHYQYLLVSDIRALHSDQSIGCNPLPSAVFSLLCSCSPPRTLRFEFPFCERFFRRRRLPLCAYNSLSIQPAFEVVRSAFTASPNRFPEAAQMQNPLAGSLTHFAHFAMDQSDTA